MIVKQEFDPIARYLAESPHLATFPLVVGLFWGGVGVRGPMQ